MCAFELKATSASCENRYLSATLHEGNERLSADLANPSKFTRDRNAFVGSLHFHGWARRRTFRTSDFQTSTKNVAEAALPKSPTCWPQVAHLASSPINSTKPQVLESCLGYWSILHAIRGLRYQVVCFQTRSEAVPRGRRVEGPVHWVRRCFHTKVWRLTAKGHCPPVLA